MRLPRLLPATALLAVGAVLATASAAAAAPLTAYEMPFPCGQAWTGTTRPSHSPSPWSIDWNRTDDVGDPVVAAAAGVVTTAVPNGTRGYGRYVVVDHGNGESTLYGHLQTRERRHRADRRPGQPGRAPGRHRQRHRPAPALRGASQRQDGRAVVPRGGLRLREHAAVAELPRRPAGRQLRRRRRRRAGRLRPRHLHVPDQPADRPDPGDLRRGHRLPGRRGLGRRRHGQRRRTPFVRPHLLPVDAERGRVRRAGQAQRPAGRRRLERRPHLGHRRAEGGQQRLPAAQQHRQDLPGPARQGG